jgi:hypothetical protein
MLLEKGNRSEEEEDQPSEEREKNVEKYLRNINDFIAGYDEPQPQP